MKYTIKYLIYIIFLWVPLLSFASSLKIENNFLVISDIHLDTSSKHIMEICPSKNTEKNDLDQSTFEKLISTISDHIKNGTIAKPRFIILLGDVVGHIRVHSKSAIESESVVFNTLKKRFPDIPIFYTFGNNDSLKVNYGPFRDQAQSTSLKSPYDVAKIKGSWNNGFLSTGTMCVNKKGDFPCILTEDNINGFYSAYLKPKFRLISLNTILFSPKRTYLTKQDAMTQLQWLSHQLKSAEEQRESVLIAMHIPPGNNVYDHSSFWLQEEQTVFLKLIKRYQNNITGILSSHTHAEELKIIKDELNKNIAGVYFTAALSTSHGNAPSLKTFYFSKNDNGQWLLSNYETFHFVMNHSNIIFSKLYDYTHYYCDHLDNNNMLNCLGNITPEKMKKYFSAGNPHYDGIMRAPDDIVVYKRP